ncbi:MAG: sulfatase [Candidatus Brocadiia bacterium]
MGPKNIVFLQADQLAARQLHCYGGEIESSSTLDRLAGEGLRFDRCYTTFPICLPNRATMLTSRTPGVHGLIAGGCELHADNPTYAHVLKREGYHIGGFGKFHREGTSSPHPRVLDDLGFDEFTIVEDDKRGPYLQWIRDEHPEYYELALGRLGKHKGHLTEEQLRLREKARERVFRPLMKETQYAHMFPSPFPAEVHDTKYITDLGLKFMEEHLENRPDEPFFCQISYVDPHDPYDPPEPYSKMYNAEDMPEPLPQEWREQGPECLDDHNALNCKVIREKNPPIFREAAALYHGSIRFMDDQIARIIKFLEERDLVEDTVVVFTTDHGDMMGDHGFMAKGFVHYDGCIRCPLIVWGGGTEQRTTDRMVCALDFFPTFCEIAEASRDVWPPIEGKSFAGTCFGEEDEEQWNEIAVNYRGVQSVVTDDWWRLTRYHESNEGQMFNLLEDPKEQNNLYKDPACTDKKLELLERMIAVSMRPYRIPGYRNVVPRRRKVEYLGD